MTEEKDEKQQVEWEQVKIRPYVGLSEQIKSLRDKLDAVRDQLASHLDEVKSKTEEDN